MPIMRVLTIQFFFLQFANIMYTQDSRCDIMVTDFFIFFYSPRKSDSNTRTYLMEVSIFTGGVRVKLIPTHGYSYRIEI